MGHGCGIDVIGLRAEETYVPYDKDGGHTLSIGAEGPTGAATVLHSKGKFTLL